MHKENWFFCLNFFSSPLGLWQIMPRALEASLALRWTRWTRVPWASSIKAKRRGTNPRKVTAVGTRCEHFIFLKKKQLLFWSRLKRVQTNCDGGLFYCHKWCWSDYKQTFNPTVTQASNLFCNFGWKKKWLIWILGSERWSVWRTDGDIYAELILHTGELLSLILIIYYIICDWSLKGVIIGWVLLL